MYILPYCLPCQNLTKLLLWCWAGKNLYNNEHVAIKLVSFCVLHTDVKLIFYMRVYGRVCSSENVNVRFQPELNSLQVG